MNHKLLVTIIFALCFSYGKENGYVVGPDKVWPQSFWSQTATLKVCWDPPGNTVRIIDKNEGDTLGIFDVGTAKRDVENTIKKTWESIAGVTFQFDDIGGKGCDIKIDVSEVARASSNSGRNKVGPTLIYLNLTHLRYLSSELGGMTSSQIHRIRQEYEAWRAKAQSKGILNSFLKEFIRYTAVHEFGHALGMYHEQDRVDDASLFGDNPYSKGSQPGTGGIPIGIYDPYSIMNYYSYDFVPDSDGTVRATDRDKLTLPDFPRLSCGDLITARYLYPPPTSKLATAPCCTLDGYSSLLGIKDIRLSWADFYQNNRSCFDQGDSINLGALKEKSCESMAKAAAGQEVCNTKIPETENWWQDIVSCDWKTCEVMRTEKPEYQARASIVWKSNKPIIRLVLHVTNLDNVMYKRILTGVFEGREYSSNAYNPLAFTSISGGFDRNTIQQLDTMTLEFPMGFGSYNPKWGCYCTLEPDPPKGSYTKYYPDEDAFLVDHTISSIRFNAVVKEGMRSVTYKDRNHTEVDWNVIPLIYDYVSHPEFLLSTGNEFRIAQAWTNIGNHPPGKPTITHIDTTDSGSSIIRASWSSVTDADNDPVYYIMEVRRENSGEFKRYPVLGATSYQVKGLLRSTSYQVRVCAFDAKDRVCSDISTIVTPDRPETCNQTNTEKVLLTFINPDIVRKEIPLFPYFKTQGTQNVTTYQYPNSFCYEDNLLDSNYPYFSDVTDVADIQSTDWLYLESDNFYNIYLSYKDSSGTIASAAPGINSKNDWGWPSSPNPNLIRLADWWGDSAKYRAYGFWPSSSPVTKITVKFPKYPNYGRIGRLLVLKENPFGVNFKGLRINNANFSQPPYRYTTYIGAPLELELFTTNTSVRYTGTFPFHKSSWSAKVFQYNPTAIDTPTIKFKIESQKFAMDTQSVSIRLDVKSLPTFNGLIDEKGDDVRFLCPNRNYRLDIRGLAKPIESIQAFMNENLLPLVNVRGMYSFSLGDIKAVNTISIKLDGVELPKMKFKKFPRTASQLLLN